MFILILYVIANRIWPLNILAGISLQETSLYGFENYYRWRQQKWRIKVIIMRSQ